MPQPYETMIQILRRGGGISKRDTFLINNSLEVNLRKEHKNPLPSLEDDFLDYINDCCGVHLMNIPNEDEIVLLWKQYNGGEKLYQKDMLNIS